MNKIVISLIIVAFTISVALFVSNVSSVEASQSSTVYGSDVIVYSDEASVGSSFMLYTKYEFSTGYTEDSNSIIVIKSGEETLTTTEQIPEPEGNEYTKYTIRVKCNDPGMVVKVYGALYSPDKPSYTLWMTCNYESGYSTHTVEFTRPALPYLKIYVSSQTQSYKYTYPVSIVFGVLRNKALLFNGFSINGNNPNPVDPSLPSRYILSGQDYFENITSLKLLFNDKYISATTDILNLEVNLKVVIDGVLYEVFNGYDTSFDMSKFVFGETGITINSSNYSFYENFIRKFEGSYITSAQMQVEALQNGNYRYTINVYMESRLWSDNYYSGAIVLVKDIFINVMDVLSVDILPNISVLDIFGVVVFVGFAFFIFKLLGY